MVTHRSSGARSLRLLVQLTAVSLSYLLWLVIWEPESLVQPVFWSRYLLCGEFLLIALLFSFRVSPQLAGPHQVLPQSIRLTVRQAGAGMFAILLVLFLVNDSAVSRSFLTSYTPWLLIVLFYCNHWLPHQLSLALFSKERQEHVILAGTVARARQLRPWLDRKRELGLVTIGMLVPAGGRVDNPPFPILGELEEVDVAIQSTGVNQLIVLDLSPGAEWLRRATLACESNGVRLLAINSADEYFGHATIGFEDEGVQFVGLREEPLENPVNRLLKRLLDIAVSLPIILLLLPPVTLGVWLLQRFQSPGPVFFSQLRTGLMGRRFRMIKFRTMHLNHGQEARQASQHDERIYPAGRWMRRLSIDELPQFINVFLGDMSVVGPRPHLPQHDEAFARVMGRYTIRKFVPPGITGWAQINGFRGEIHGEQDVERRVNADIHYLESWSLSLDLTIILRTVWHCLVPPKTAY